MFGVRIIAFACALFGAGVFLPLDLAEARTRHHELLFAGRTEILRPASSGDFCAAPQRQILRAQVDGEILRA